MRLTVFRNLPTQRSTPGILEINGVFQCYTLEPRHDRSHGKPYAIPPGTYNVTIEPSPKFSQLYKRLFRTPHVHGVPGFDAIEIHIGNTPEDTHGCLLVGETRATDWVGNSEIAFNALMGALTRANIGTGGAVTITYVDHTPVPDSVLGI